VTEYAMSVDFASPERGSIAVAHREEDGTIVFDLVATVTL
jgi:hypothetical protein